MEGALKRLLVGIGILAALALAWHFITRGAKDRSDEIASVIGADFCDQSRYQITNRLDSSRTRIYDCIRNGHRLCVTYSGGIATNVTVETRLLFAGTLGAEKPGCLAA